jgi:hypothetical protein
MAAIHAARNAQQHGENASMDDDDAHPAFTVVHGTEASPRKHRPTRGKRLVAGLVAAVLCVAFLGVGGNVLYKTETAFAQVSSQATVTLGVNRFGTVVRATTEQEALQNEIDSLGLRGKTYDEAIASLAESGYLGGTDVTAQVSANGSEQEQVLVETTTTCLENAGCTGSCNGQGFGKRDGSGMGMGMGNGSGQGMGQGMGNGSGQGMGQGMGNGSGQGKGNGSGQGTGSSATGSDTTSS